MISSYTQENNLQMCEEILSNRFRFRQWENMQVTCGM